MSAHPDRAPGLRQWEEWLEGRLSPFWVVQGSGKKLEEDEGIWRVGFPDESVRWIHRQRAGADRSRRSLRRNRAAGGRDRLASDVGRGGSTYPNSRKWASRRAAGRTGKLALAVHVKWASTFLQPVGSASFSNR